MDFVVGIEVRLSSNHTLLGGDGTPHEFADICDELQGRYPKDFKFTGWHPHCRCFAVSILKTEEEMEQDTQRILNGEEPTPSEDSENAVSDLPDKFKNYIQERSETISNLDEAHTPYYIRDNRAQINPILGITPPAAAAEPQAPKVTLTEQQKARRDEIEEIARRTVLNQEIQVPEIGKIAKISNKRIKEWVNQPHKFFEAKNEALLRLKSLIEGGTYIGGDLDKRNKDVIAHLVEVDIATGKSWVIIREFRNGTLTIHSISDSESIIYKVLKRER
jgi:hypothetical protein